MSLSTPDATLVSGLRHWPRAVGRTVRGWCGRVARHALLLDAQGVFAWRDLPRSGDARDAAPIAFDSFDSWCSANPGCDARVFVSGHLLHSLLIDPALRLHGDDDAAVSRYARQQFGHYHGLAARQWPLAVWSDAGSAGACALHSLDLAALQATAAGHDVRLLGVAPLWSAGLGSLTGCTPALAAPGRHALALVEATLVTWVVVDAGRLQALQQRYLDNARTDELGRLLAQLVPEFGPLQGLPIVVGWGLEDIGHPAPMQARVCLPLSQPTAHGEWVLDRMRVAA